MSSEQDQPLQLSPVPMDFDEFCSYMNIISGRPHFKRWLDAKLKGKPYPTTHDGWKKLYKDYAPVALQAMINRELY